MRNALILACGSMIFIALSSRAQDLPPDLSNALNREMAQEALYLGLSDEESALAKNTLERLIKDAVWQGDLVVDDEGFKADILDAVKDLVSDVVGTLREAVSKVVPKAKIEITKVVPNIKKITPQ